MGDKTGIAWTDATWNPVVGCTAVSAGCENCYAARHAIRIGAAPPQYAGLARMVRDRPGWSGDVRFLVDRLGQPAKRRRPRRIFVNSMSDVFHEKLTNEQIAAIFGVMGAASHHTFQVLTKRPARMREWFAWVEGTSAPADGCWKQSTLCQRAAYAAGVRSHLHRVKGALKCYPWPLPNVWLGVSVEDQKTADERIPTLLETPAAVRWVSYEPALGPVDFRGSLPQAILACKRCESEEVEKDHRGRHAYCGGEVEPSGDVTDGLDWIVIGGESGPRARPFEVRWAADTISACKEAGVAVFMKQMGARPVNGVCRRCGGSGELGTLPDPEEDARLPKLRCMECGGVGKEGVGGLAHRAGADPSEWPERYRVREFPMEAADAPR